MEAQTSTQLTPLLSALQHTQTEMVRAHLRSCSSDCFLRPPCPFSDTRITSMILDAKLELVAGADQLRGQQQPMAELSRGSSYNAYYSPTWHSSQVVLLLERGADANARSRSGMTPLHMCAKQGNANLCELIIDRCAWHRKLTG